MSYRMNYVDRCLERTSRRLLRLNLHLSVRVCLRRPLARTALVTLTPVAQLGLLNGKNSNVNKVPGLSLSRHGREVLRLSPSALLRLQPRNLLPIKHVSVDASNLVYALTVYVLGTSVGGPGVLRAKSSASSGGSSKSGTGTNTSSIRSVSPLAPPSSQSGSGRDSSPLSPTEGVYSGQVSVPGVDVEGALKALSLDEEDFDEDFYSLRYSASVAGDAGNAIRSAETGAPITGSLWDDYVDDDEDDDDPQDNQLDLVKAALKQPGLCREHNRVCKRGICKWYAAQLREEEKERRKMECFQQRELREMRMNNKRNASPENGSSPPSRSSSPPPARRPPPHLRAGPPAPTLGPPRQLPPHLRRGAAPASAPVASPPSPISPPVHISPTPSKKSGDDDRSVSSSGSRAALSKPTTADPSTVPSSVPAPSRPWGTWGRAPSITASSVQRNNESWSVSARGIDDVQSVAGRSEASGQGAKATREGPWGNTDAVRSAASQGARTNRTYARSVAGSVASASTARTWGNVSAGPW